MARETPARVGLVRGGLIWAGVVAWILALFLLLVQLDVARIHPIAGAQIITEVTLCESPTCAAGGPAPLPYLTPERFFDGVERHHLRAELNLEPAPPDLQVLYIPKFSDHLSIWINDAQVYQAQVESRLWNEPLLVDVSPQILRAGVNVLRMELTGVEPSRLDLHPFLIGDYAALKGAYERRFLLGPGATRFILGMVATLSIGCFLVWLNRRRDRHYLWLSLSCASACVFLWQSGVGFPLSGYKMWMVAHTLAISAYVLFMLKFMRTFLEVQLTWIERAHGVLLVIGAAVMLATPVEVIYDVSLAVNLVTAVSAVSTVVMIWEHRKSVTTVDFYIFFPILSLALMLAFDGLLLSISNQPARSMNLLHFMPFMTSLVCFWLILSQLIQSLTKQEALAATLQDTVDEKTRELAANYAKLAKVEKAEAVHQERSRIMMELHDGVGGQLVSTLAYIENHHKGDPTLRSALEDALRDLALMLDSIENEGDLPTLLGMLRVRLDGLLSAQGITLNWRIEDDLILPDSNPSANLHVARIAQEAITNAIKHSGARAITVSVNKASIAVSDDGAGFHVSTALSAPGSGRGLAGMKQRALSIGCTLVVKSDESGTSVKLSSHSEKN
ncbi:MAG: 7TM diverse intracellular signaling domain-containing protein [Aliishimia sp.]